MGRSLDFSAKFLYEKVDILAEDSGGGFEHWGRSPDWVAGKCSDYGFGNPNGLPTAYLAIARAAHRTVGWIRFQDQRTADGKVHKKQLLPQTKPLVDLRKKLSWSTPRR